MNRTISRVIEPHERDAIGDQQAELARNLKRRKGHLVIACDDRGRRVVEAKQFLRKSWLAEREGTRKPTEIND